MAFLLLLETSTTVCSVAISDGDDLLALREINEGYSHSENITVFIEEVLNEAGLKMSQLDAVAVSSGPGSYTGLRIGVSTAKGICYALDKPLIAVGTLDALAAGFSKELEKSPPDSNTQPRYFLADLKNYQRNYPRALEARKNPTQAEETLWNVLRGKKLGQKFRRQHLIGQFIADFVCVEKRLVIEVDGDIHKDREEYDAGREAMLNDFGFHILRFSNEEVINEMYMVIEKIRHAIDNRGDLSPGPFPGERGATERCLFIPMIDARRMEVYCGVFDASLNSLEPVSAKIVDKDSFASYLEKGKVYFFGDGADKCKSIIQHENAVFADKFFPSAAYMISMAFEKLSKGDFENLALYEPFYLKDFVPGLSKKKI